MKLYTIENGHLQNDGTIFYYDLKIFTSKKSYEFYIKNSFEVNKGFNLVRTENTYGEKIYYIAYDCLSTDGRPMKVYLRVQDTKTYYN